jgi:beta-glucosidase
VTRPSPDVERKVEALISAMTDEEKVSLLAGASTWETAAIARLGVPAIRVSDGPNGARGGGALVGGVRAACFPAAISLASSWNPALVREVGEALAEEALSKGARVLLAPTVNLHRGVLNGRNFECYSEDPYLTAQLAAAYITGLQSRGVAATIKHFVGNESEVERMTISSEIPERALRELYLVPFEVAVKEAGVWAVMCAYNKLGGLYASEHPRLLTEILRHEWGFDGLVMSDWFATHSTAASLNAGLDLEMPGPPLHRGEKLLAALRAGEVSKEALDRSVRRVLVLALRVGAFDAPELPEERAVDRPEHRALIRRAGAEGTVLLKNSGVLPLDPQKLTKVAVIGPNARVAQIMGGGSAQVNAHYRVSPWEGLRALLGEGALEYELGCTNHKFAPLLEVGETPVGRVEGLRVAYFNTPDLTGEVVHRADVPSAELMWFGEVAPGVAPVGFSVRLEAHLTPSASGEHRFGLASAGLSRLFVDGEELIDNWRDWRAGETYFGMGSDERVAATDLEAGRTYALRLEYSYPERGALGLRAVRLGAEKPLGDEALARAAALAKEADVALLFVGHSGEWDTEGRDRTDINLAGAQDALITRVAEANPNTVVVLQTGAPVAMPWLGRVAAVLQGWYPGQECGNALADVLFGRVNPSGRLPQTYPVRLEDTPTLTDPPRSYPGEGGRVHYTEGLLVGYRHFDTRAIAPLFPFGFGLSYTTFAYGEVQLSAARLAPGETLRVTVPVTNTGARAGAEVVQLYVRDPEARLARPEKELKAFAKVFLEPGETQAVGLELGMRAFAFFDPEPNAWVAEAGRFELLVGRSAAEIVRRASVTLTDTWLEPVAPHPS